MKTFLLIVFASGMTFCCLPATAQVKMEKTALLSQWQDYFKSIHSLHVNTKINVPLIKGEEKYQGFRATFNLWIDGRKYRVDQRIATPIDISAYSNAFDGQYYQSLEAGDTSILYITKNTKSHEAGPYLGSFPLMYAFSFAFAKGDVNSLETLQSPSTWTYFAKRVVSLQPSVREGISGYRMIVKPFVNSSSRDGEKEVFINGKTLFPMFIEEKQDINNTNTVTRTIVRSVVKVGLPPLNVFPTSVDMEFIEKGSAVGKFSLVTDGPIIVNQAVSNQLFTIPKNQVSRVWTDKDTERFQKEVEKQQAADKAKAEKAKTKEGQQ